MSQIGDLRTALRENLKAIPGVQVSRFALVQPEPPGFHLWPSEIPAYHRTFGDHPVMLSEVHFTVQAFVGFQEHIGSQEIMDEFLDTDGERSVVVAVEADKRLGGLCDDLLVESSTGYGFTVTSAGTPLLTSDWLVTVYV